MAEIFVFGSNLLGIHKRGAALHALNHHGAILGQGLGYKVAHMRFRQSNHHPEVWI